MEGAAVVFFVRVMTNAYGSASYNVFVMATEAVLTISGVEYDPILIAVRIVSWGVIAFHIRIRAFVTNGGVRIVITRYLFMVRRVLLIGQVGT